jgi:Spy/CpxP family protein refolding chaperone
MGQMGGDMHDRDMPMKGCGMMGGIRHQDMGTMQGMAGEMKEHMMDDDSPLCGHLMALGLDEKQKEAITGIRNRLMKEMIRKQADRAIAKVELKELLDKDPVDMKAVETKLKQLETVQTDIHLSHIRTKEEIKSKLTPEQKKRFKEIMEMHPMKGKMGMMHGEGCGMMHHGDEAQKKTPPAEKKEEKEQAPGHTHH